LTVINIAPQQNLPVCFSPLQKIQCLYIKEKFNTGGFLRRGNRIDTVFLMRYKDFRTTFRRWKTPIYTHATLRTLQTHFLFASLSFKLLGGRKDGRTDGRTDRQTDRRTDIQTDRQTDRQCSQIYLLQNGTKWTLLTFRVK